MHTLYNDIKLLQTHQWLFVLALMEDEHLSFYGCLAICSLSSSKGIERQVREAGSLNAVSVFLRKNRPANLAKSELKHRCVEVFFANFHMILEHFLNTSRSGRTDSWLNTILNYLQSSVTEVQGMALFQILMELTVRRENNDLEVNWQSSVFFSRFVIILFIILLIVFPSYTFRAEIIMNQNLKRWNLSIN